METITNAVNSVMGYDTTTDKATTGNQLGELVHDREGTQSTHSTSQSGLGNTSSGYGQSGVEPVNGRLGAGVAGQPYDAGNEEELSGRSGTSGLTGGSGLTGHSTSSGLTGHSDRTGNSGLTGSSGLGSSGLTGTSGHSHHSTGLGGNSLSTVGSGDHGNASSGYTGNTSRTGGFESTGGYGGTTGPTVGTAGYESTSGYGNNTGYDESTSRGLGAGAPQQANHYVTTAVAGKLPSAFGMNAVHQVGGTQATVPVIDYQDSSRGQDSNYGRDSSYEQSSRSHGLGGSHSGSGHGGIHGLGSDRSAGNSNDRYLFNASNAPGAGGRGAYGVDDFTDANIHHEGAGGITGELGSDASSGKATGIESGSRHHSSSTGYDSGSGSDLSSNKGKERVRKPGFGRMGSGVGYGTHGLNYGAPRESIGERLEQRVESHAPAAGLAGAGAAGYGATYSGREPLSGVRGSGVGGEPYDQGNTYDGTNTSGGLTGRERQYGAGLTGHQSEYGQDRGMSQTTSGMKNMNLGQEHSGYGPGQGAYVTTVSGEPYPGTDRDVFGAQGTRSTHGTEVGGYGASNTSNYGSNEAGLNQSQGTGEYGTSSTSNYGSGNVDLSKRFAGVPNTSGVGDDCDTGHHNAHPHGEAAHEDGVAKPTFLSYQPDNFGAPNVRRD